MLHVFLDDRPPMHGKRCSTSPITAAILDPERRDRKWRDDMAPAFELREVSSLRYVPLAVSPCPEQSRADAGQAVQIPGSFSSKCGLSVMSDGMGKRLDQLLGGFAT
jgi:hypothetical protein